MRLSGPSADCITNGPVYLTNVGANFTTNEGWTVYFDIAGGTNEVVYDIFSTTEFLGNDITNSIWTWLETGMTCETHWFTNQPTNQVFFVLTVPGADRDGDGLYDGWEWKHFGGLEQQQSGDYDGDGVSNLEAYTNDYNPNNLTFSLAAASPYVSSATVPVSVNLLTGVAESMAVLLDNTNLTAANWTSFSSNLTVNLGATEGWHELRVGLRGHFAEVQSWQSLRLKLDVTPPRLVVTNPIWLTNSQPLLQLQGYGNEPLANISYNLTNAAGNFTNQPGYVTFEAYNTNTFEFATNYFQCYDVWLTNGANAITVRIADLAGNTTTTNLTLTLDGAGAVEEHRAQDVGTFEEIPGGSLEANLALLHEDGALGQGERDVHRTCRGRVRRDIEITLGIGSRVIDGGWDHAMVHRERTGDEFHSTGGAKHVPSRRLGGTD